MLTSSPKKQRFVLLSNNDCILWKEKGKEINKNKWIVTNYWSAPDFFPQWSVNENLNFRFFCQHCSRFYSFCWDFPQQSEDLFCFLTSIAFYERRDWQKWVNYHKLLVFPRFLSTVIHEFEFKIFLPTL